MSTGNAFPLGGNAIRGGVGGTSEPAPTYVRPVVSRTMSNGAGR